MSNRDTQFQGFAKALLDELVRNEGARVVSNHWRAGIESIIARRAYDLVEHAIRSQAQGMDLFCLHDPEWMKERIDRMADMTELPKEQE